MMTKKQHEAFANRVVGKLLGRPDGIPFLPGELLLEDQQASCCAIKTEARKQAARIMVEALFMCAHIVPTTPSDNFDIREEAHDYVCAKRRVTDEFVASLKTA